VTDAAPWVVRDDYCVASVASRPMKQSANPDLKNLR
jgi:hypothetical protein